MPISRDKHNAPLVSVEEAADILGQSRSALYRAIERDDVPVPVFTINGRYRIARRSLERLIAGDLHGGADDNPEPATAGSGPPSAGAVHHRPLTHPAPRRCARRLGGPPR
jgi:hypothetical protein